MFKTFLGPGKGMGWMEAVGALAELSRSFRVDQL